MTMATRPQPQWTEEVPTEPGKYWFYGKRFRGSASIEMYFVKVRGTRNSLAFVADGAFIFPNAPNEASGFWMPATLPDPPEEADDEHAC